MTDKKRPIESDDEIPKIREIIIKNPTVDGPKSYKPSIPLFERAIKTGELNHISTYGFAAIHEVAYLGFDEHVIYLLKKGADINLKDSEGRSAISWATQCGFDDTVKLLIDNGAQVDSTDCYDMTSLHCALINRHYSTATILLANGADVTRKSQDGDNVYDLSNLSPEEFEKIFPGTAEKMKAVTKEESG